MINIEQFMNNPQYLFYVVICICLIVMTACCVIFIFSVVAALKRMKQSLKIIDKRIQQLEPLLDKAGQLEENLNELMITGQLHLERLQNEAVHVMEELSKTLDHFKKLQSRLEEKLEKDVPPILQETKEFVSGVNDIAHDMQKKIQASNDFFEALTETSHTVKTATGLLKGGLTGLAVQLASIAVGMKKSIEYVTDNIHKGGKPK